MLPEETAAAAVDPTVSDRAHHDDNDGTNPISSRSSITATTTAASTLVSFPAFISTPPSPLPSSEAGDWSSPKSDDQRSFEGLTSAQQQQRLAEARKSKAAIRSVLPMTASAAGPSTGRDTVAAERQPLLSGATIADEDHDIGALTDSVSGGNTGGVAERDGESAIAIGSRTTFTRNLGAAEAFAIVVSIVIGSGVFTSPGSIDTNVPSPGVALVVWLVGGVLAWTGASTMAELGTAIPGEGTVFLMS